MQLDMTSSQIFFKKLFVQLWLHYVNRLTKSYEISRQFNSQQTQIVRGRCTYY